MNIDNDTRDIVELGVASEATQGGILKGSEPGGRVFPMGGISDED